MYQDPDESEESGGEYSEKFIFWLEEWERSD